MKKEKNIVDVVKFISYMMVHFVLAVISGRGFHLLTKKVGTEERCSLTHLCLIQRLTKLSKLLTTKQKCKRCSHYVKAHNEYFLRCPNCALLVKRE